MLSLTQSKCILLVPSGVALPQIQGAGMGVGTVLGTQQTPLVPCTPVRLVLCISCFIDEEAEASEGLAVTCPRSPRCHTTHSWLGRDLNLGQTKSCTLSHYSTPIYTESGPLVLHVDEKLSDWQSPSQFPQRSQVTGRRWKKRESLVGE